MGLDGIAAHAVWVVTLVVVAGTLLPTGFTVWGDADEAWVAGAEQDRKILRTRFGELDGSWDSGASELTIRVRNDGEVAINGSTVTVVVDGEPKSTVALTVDYAGSSDRWLPGESANLTVSDVTSLPGRILIVTADGYVGHGTAPWYTYAAASATEVFAPGGTVTDVANLTRASGDTSALKEARNLSAHTIPATANDRTFDAAPVTGWTLTDVQDTHTLAHDASEGTPTADGAIYVEKDSGGAGQAYVEHAWAQGGPATTDLDFSMDFMPKSNEHADRAVDVYLVKPNLSSVLIVGTQTWTNSTWNALSGTVAAADMDVAGTYTLRIDVHTRAGKDTYHFDNVVLTYTAYESYRFAQAFTVPDIPTDPSYAYDLQVRYRTTSGTEALRVEVEGPSGTWTDVGSLSSTTMATATFTLTSDQVMVDTANVRFIDALAVSDAAQGHWDVDFIRVRIRP